NRTGSLRVRSGVFARTPGSFVQIKLYLFSRSSKGSCWSLGTPAGCPRFFFSFFAVVSNERNRSAEDAVLCRGSGCPRKIPIYFRRRRRQVISECQQYYKSSPG